MASLEVQTPHSSTKDPEKPTATTTADEEEDISPIEEENLFLGWLVAYYHYSGAWVRMGRAAEEVCGGTSLYVVAQHSRSGLSFPGFA
ncbi:hypothetical protein Q3G72_007137 [Acer saccharum]|nr:hypothetical protein Q3G72_007137 [Acer saccharum]